LDCVAGWRLHSCTGQSFIFSAERGGVFSGVFKNHITVRYCKCNSPQPHSVGGCRTDYRTATAALYKPQPPPASRRRSLGVRA